MTEATALTEDGREVRLTQTEPGAPVTYAVADDRFSDGWRVVGNPDDVAELLVSVHAAQLAAKVDNALADAAAEVPGATVVVVDDDPPDNDPAAPDGGDT